MAPQFRRSHDVATAIRPPDRALYLSGAVAVCALVIAGFWPSYFSKIFGVNSEPLTRLVHLHGVLMSAWISLFGAQALLIALGRADIHRQLGKVGFVLLTLIVLVAVPMTLEATRLGGNHMPGPALPGLALVMALFVEFLTLGSLGLFYRHRSDIHKRLMLLAAFAAMEAGVSRLPLDMLDSVVKIHLANDLLPLTAIIVDTVRHRRLHPAFAWGFAFLVLVQMLSAWLSGTEAWLQVARSIMRHFP